MGTRKQRGSKVDLLEDRIDNVTVFRFYQENIVIAEFFQKVPQFWVIKTVNLSVKRIILRITPSLFFTQRIGVCLEVLILDSGGGFIQTR